MNGWDELLGRLTDRLSVDRELRLDVAQELRGHLEDSADEFRRGGASEAEAAQSAARALGDETELAEQLWQANRGRMRLRGVLRWMARVTLIPAAIAVVAAVLLGLAGGHRSSPSEFLDGDYARIPASWTKHLSDQQRFILQGAPTAKTPLEAAKSITDRWPDNPIYYGNYVVRFLAQPRHWRHSERDPTRLGEVLAVLDWGEKIDRDNAFYNFEKAAWLIGLASTVSKDPARTCRVKDRRGEVREKPYCRVEIHDAAQFQRGVSELQRGLGKGEFTGRSIDMLYLRLDMLPAPSRYNDYLRRMAMEVSALLPSLGSHGDMAKALCAHAVALAEQGRADEAIALIDSVGLMATKMGARSKTLMPLLVGTVIRRVALAHAERVYEELGRSEEAKKARAALAEEDAFVNDFRNRPRLSKRQLTHAGALGSVLIPSIPGYQMDLEPMRTAEQFVAAEMALLILLDVLVLAALLMGGMTVISLLFRRKEDRPVLLFVGWRQIGRICLLAVVLPLAVYALYSYTGRDRAYGIGYTFDKTVLEFVVFIAAVLLLLGRLSYSAIRRRAEQLGLDVPAPIRLRDRRWMAASGALLALAVAVYLGGWWAGLLEPRPRIEPGHGLGSVLAVVVFGFLLVWKVREYFGITHRRRYAAFRRTLTRSAVPILAAAVIIIGVSCGWLLARGERSAVRRIKGKAAISVRNEIERSDYRLLRERMAAQHEQMMAARR